MTPVFKAVPGRQWLELDERLCIRFHRAARLGPVCQIFRIVSRLGNDVFWDAPMGALLAIRGVAAVRVVLHMASVGLMCALPYKCLKAKTSRPPPYEVNQAITCNARRLDPFSFPSGHTLHTVAFTTIASASLSATALVC